MSATNICATALTLAIIVCIYAISGQTARNRALTSTPSYSTPLVIR